ncbi:MAG: hypothetical protein ACYDCL_13675 [Myxococcales bacterium]
MTDASAESSTPERAIVGRPFPKGTSGNPGGLPREIREARAALSVHLPRAVEILGQLLDNEDPRIALAAASEICDRTVGRPRPVAEDTAAFVRAELSALFARLRATFDPAIYQRIVAEVLDATR